MSLSEIKIEAQKAEQSKLDIVVTLSADKGVVYDSVIHLMDDLRQTGVSNFALQLEPEEKK